MIPGTRGRGYSLFELVMTLALAGLVLGLGLPSLGSIVADQRLRAETDALFHAVHLARKESIVRRRIVTICPSRDGTSCDADGDWSAGWIMFANIGRSTLGHRQDTETLLRTHVVGSTAILSSNRAGYAFRATHERATNGTVVFCDRRNRTPARALVISYTGRPRVARTDNRGRPYTCAH
jgi:type IV fimbrial biogenesis protein FimT